MQDNSANNQQPNPNQNVPTWFASAPEPPQNPKRRVSKKAWAGIIAAFLVVILGAGAFAYTFWYQNPQKVIADGIMNAVVSEDVSYNGLFSTSMQDGVSIKANYNGQSGAPGHKISGTVDISAQDATYNIKGDVVYMNEGTVFVKAGNLKNVYSQLSKQYGFLSDDEISSKVVEKVDDQWIRIEPSDTEELNSDASKTQACVSDALKKAREDRLIVEEMVNVYKENAFISVKEERGVQNGSYGYVLGFDEEAAKQFVQKANDTKFMKQLIDCDESLKLDASDVDSSDNDVDGEVTIWITQFGHEISKIEATGKDNDGSGTFVIEPTFNQGVSVEKPENSMTFEELQKDLEELFMQQYSSEAQAESMRS